MTDPSLPPARPVRMRRLVGWGVVGQIGYVASQFILLMALAQFQTVEIVGAFGLASAISFPVISLFNLGLRTNVATDVEGNYHFADFMRLRIVSCFAAFGLLAVIALFAVGEPVQSILLVFSAAKVVELISELCYGVFQRADRMALVARSQSLRGLVSAFFFTILLAFGFGADVAFVGNLAVWAFVAMVIDLRAAYGIAAEQGDKGKAAWPRVWSLTIASLPLGLNGGLSAIQGNVPRYVLGWMVGLAALGQFTVVSYAMQAISTVFNAISQSIVSRLAQYNIRGQRVGFFRFMRKFTIILSSLGIILTAVSLLIGDQVIVLLFGSEYDGVGTLLALIVVAAIIRSAMIIFQAGLQAARMFYLIVRVRIAFLGIMAFACIAGTSLGGLIGLAWAMIAVYVTQAAVLFALLHRLPFTMVEDIEH